jgi:replication-associated recombination protein RarA
MKELLLSEKYRPTTIDEMVLLPRISKYFENGITENVILYGHFGTGKTTLANILIGAVSKDKPCLSLNSSYYTSIETLRTKIDDFCTKVYMGLDLKTDIKNDDIKYVFLDEFERTSIQYQDALKAYIEDYSKKNVRFILCTNHINKVSKGILSRMVKINFDCENALEEKELKKLFYKKIINDISVKENFTISKENLAEIINKNFPDFRQTYIAIATFLKTGELSKTSNVDIKTKEELYKLCLNTNANFDTVYHFLMDTFTSDNIDVMLLALGIPFIEYIGNTNNNLIEKMFKVCNIVTKYSSMLETSADPLILGITVIDEIHQCFR